MARRNLSFVFSLFRFGAYSEAPEKRQDTERTVREIWGNGKEGLDVWQYLVMVLEASRISQHYVREISMI